ncbi:MAG: hypothetical protein WCW16_02745 [Candidatus Magasanikbacteria bacterium]
MVRSNIFSNLIAKSPTSFTYFVGGLEIQSSHVLFSEENVEVMLSPIIENDGEHIMLSIPNNSPLCREEIAIIKTKIIFNFKKKLLFNRIFCDSKIKNILVSLRIFYPKNILFVRPWPTNDHRIRKNSIAEKESITMDKVGFSEFSTFCNKYSLFCKGIDGKGKDMELLTGQSNSKEYHIIKRLNNSWENKDIIECLIDLIIAFDSIFGERHESTYKVALRSAFFIGKSAQERKTIFEFIRVLYDIRSRIIHENKIIKELEDEVSKSVKKKLILFDDVTDFMTASFKLEYLLKKVLHKMISTEVHLPKNNNYFDALLFEN